MPQTESMSTVTDTVADISVILLNVNDIFVTVQLGTAYTRATPDAEMKKEMKVEKMELQHLEACQT